MPANKSKIFKTAFAVYESVRVIGQGGSGRVFEVINKKGERFAIKVLDQKLVTTSRLGRFENELAFCLRNSHPNIVHVAGYGFLEAGTQTVPFYVMPLYQTTLRKLIDQGIPAHQALLIFQQLMDAVDAAHRSGVWHRDIKPQNILFDSATGSPILADFGIAHFSEALLKTAVKTSRGDRLANFQYAAPEQRRPGSECDHRADIFSLGMLLNELFTSKAPHALGFKRISDVCPELGALDALVEKMMQDDPARRPQAIADIRESFLDIAAVKSALNLGRQDVMPKDAADEGKIPTSLMQQAITLRNRIDHSGARERLWRSYEGVQAATDAAERIVARIKTIVEHLKGSGLALSVASARSQREIAIEGHGLAVMVSWNTSFGNSLDESELEISFWTGKAPLSGREFFKSPVRIGLQSYVPAVDMDGSLKWSPKDAPASIVADGDVAEYAISKFLEMVDKQY